jgi:hypothetical protein
MGEYDRQSQLESSDLYTITPRIHAFSKWYILPLDLEDDRIYFGETYYGFNHIYRKLNIDRGRINTFTDISKNIIKGLYAMSNETAERLEKMIYANQDFRWKMKRLIHGWRLAKLKIANTEDIMTGEAPKKPVYIYDWAQRAKYVLEAHTLYRDICERLFKADGLFTNTLYPRNMFTNTEFSTGQIHFITQDLRRYGYANWALQGLQSCNYQLNIFTRVYKQAIHLEVLKRCFANYTSNECTTLLLDFIELEYEHHAQDCVISDVLLWYIRAFPECPLIQAWRKLCFKYYKHAYMNNDINYHDIIHLLSRDIMNTSLNFIYEKYSLMTNQTIAIYYFGNNEVDDDDDDDI